MKIDDRGNQRSNSLSSSTLPKIESRLIQACFDRQGIYVYQAYSPAVAREAVERGTFGKGFDTDRFTWIKPSLGWMLYRSNFATRTGQERILKIKISFENFDTILRNATPAIYDPALFPTVENWRNQLKAHDLIYQWDPARDLSMNRIKGLRSIQLGIGPTHIKQYMTSWIDDIIDVTDVVRQLKELRGAERASANPFVESIYEPPKDIRKKLGMGF